MSRESPHDTFLLPRSYFDVIYESLIIGASSVSITPAIEGIQRWGGTI